MRWHGAETGDTDDLSYPLRCPGSGEPAVPRGSGRIGGPALLWLRVSFPCGSLRRCESLVEVYFQLHQQVMAASTELGAELLPRLLERFNEVLSSLVKR